MIRYPALLLSALPMSRAAAVHALPLFTLRRHAPDCSCGIRNAPDALTEERP